MILAFSIFLITLIFIIWQPRGLQIGTTAVVGAVVALLAGVVSLDDVVIVYDIIWDATLAFIGIIILSMVLDEIGFFEWAALKMAKLSNGNGHLMFAYSIILGAIVAALFANDGAALILTPILLAKMNILKLNTKTILAFLLAGGFISDSASLPFVFSNLTNIVTANYFEIGFAEFFSNMILPFIVSVMASMLVLWLVLRKDIPTTVDINLLKNPDDVIKNKTLFKFSWLFLALLLAGYFVGDAYDIPISVFALGGGVLFLIIATLAKAVEPKHIIKEAPWQVVWFSLGLYIVGDAYDIPISVFALGGGVLFLLIATLAKAVEPKHIIKEAPWQVVWFSLGLYIVVYGLKNAGLTDYIAEILVFLNTQSETVAIVGTGFLAAFLSAFMNNMPTIMVMDIALVGIANEAMIYANIIGCNLGPKMTPFGSLATLLWLHSLEKKGVKISFWSYSKFGLIVTPPVLLVVLLSLT